MVREIFNLPLPENNQPEQNSGIAEQQWQPPADVMRAAGPTVYQQQRPGFANDSQPYPQVIYQPRPGQWQNPGGAGDTGPVSPSGRAPYGPSGTIPTDGGGTTYYPPQQYPPQQPGYNPQQPGYYPQQPGYYPPQPGQQNPNPYLPQQPGGYPPQPGAPAQPGGMPATTTQPPRPTGDVPPAPAPGSSSSDNSGSGFGFSNIVDYGAMAGGSYLARKQYKKSFLDPTKMWRGAADEIQPQVNAWESASGSYTDAIGADARRYKDALTKIASDRGLDPKAALADPSFEKALGGEDLLTLRRYKAMDKDLTNINSYWERIKGEAPGTSPIGKWTDVPPKSALTPELSRGIGLTKDSLNEYNAATEGLSTKMGSMMKQQESAIEKAGMRNLGVLGGGLLGNMLVDHMMFKGDKPSFMTEAADFGAPLLVTLIPKGNMAVKIASIVALHTIFKALDHENQHNQNSGG